MGSIGRNDPCPCGSGVKYKKCCVNKNIDKFALWRRNAEDILYGETQKDDIISVFFELLKFIDKKRWAGACHAVSAIFYILLCEKGIKPVLCLGEAQAPSGYFDHSWIEIDDKVYDVAVYLTLNETMIYPPVIKGINVASKALTEGRYGVKSGFNRDIHAQMIKSIPFNDYLDKFPEHRDGLLGYIKEIGIEAGLNLNIDMLKEKYKDTKWIEK